MLTGTPLQNDLEELQNLLQFLLPDVFNREDINQSADLQVSSQPAPHIHFNLLLCSNSNFQALVDCYAVHMPAACHDGADPIKLPLHACGTTPCRVVACLAKVPLHRTCSFLTDTLVQEEEAVKGLTNRMKAMLSPFVLRRLKSQVASQLTAKQQHEELVSMTPEQAALYQKAVQQLRADAAGVAAKGVTATACSTLSAALLVCQCVHVYCLSYL